MGSDWDEIKRLAADFQKAQLTSTLLKLSERNCVEIVTLLLEKQLLEVVFTNDGKEYITPAHLERETEDLLHASGGRINLVEVSKTLNVDMSRIVNIAMNLVGKNSSMHYLIGQLIHDDYTSHIAQEINEKLEQKGEVSVSDLAKQYDLPSDFLQNSVMEKYLGVIIRGRQDASDRRFFFTQAYIQRCKAKIRGALTAITRPTNVAVILLQINVPEKIFHSVWDEIAPAGIVTSKQANAQYVPHIYAKMQSDWVHSFYKQNGFLEYDTVGKLGISDAKHYIRKQFPKEDIMFLKRCAIGSRIIELTVLTALTECSAAKSYVDLTTLLPTNMSAEDVEEIYNAIVAQKSANGSNFVYLDCIVFSQQYLAELVQPCYDLAAANAKAAIESGTYQQYLAEKQLVSKANSGATAPDADDDGSKLDRREERRKKASSGKAGGGSQGRETKTKSTKKHQRGGRDAEDDGDNRTAAKNDRKVRPLELVQLDDIVRTIKPQLEEESIDHLTQSIAALYLRQLNQFALGKAQELFEATPQTNRRQTHAAVQEKLNTLLVDLRLYEKGLKLLPADGQAQLSKYLLKTLGSDICNEIVVYVANECNLTLNSNSLNGDQRQKVAQECAAEYKSALLELNRALGKTIDDFLLATEAALRECSMIIKKADKKKDRQLIVQHREQLLQQLQATDDAALILHLIALILFTNITGCILHASGKFVALILAHIRASLNEEQNKLLLQYYDLVVKQMQTDETPAQISEQFLPMQAQIKQLAVTYEKPGVSRAD